MNRLALTAVLLAFSVAGCDNDKPQTPLYVRGDDGRWRLANETPAPVTSPDSPNPDQPQPTPASQPASEAVLLDIATRIEIESPGKFQRDVFPRTLVKTGGKAVAKIGSPSTGGAAVQFAPGPAQGPLVPVEVRLQLVGPRNESHRWIVRLRDDEQATLRTGLASGETLTLVLQPLIRERLGPAAPTPVAAPQLPKGPVRVEEATTNPVEIPRIYR